MLTEKFDTLYRNTSKLLSGASITMLSLLLVAAPVLPKMAQATDMVPASAVAAQGHFFRVALNKSAVLTLPADAKEIVVGNNDIADVVLRNKNTVYIFGHKTGSTNVFFFDANGQQIMALDLEVAVDTAALQNLIRRVLPGTRITVDLLGSNVILGGVAMNALEAKTAVDLANEYISHGSTVATTQNGATTQVTTGGDLIVNTIRVLGEDQVMLQVKMVEIQRDVLKQWGINFGAALNAGSLAFNLSNINPFSNATLFGNAGYGMNYSDGSGNSFTSVLRAMESDGIIHTLAEPNLTAVSGQAASFKAGGEFPYQLCQISTAATTCSISFKEYGIGLDFTPTVLSAGRINLKIHTAASELSQPQTGSGGSAGSIPSLNVRSADTVLEIPDGGSMMLAGLIREDSRQVINGTPGMRNLPILGSLFRSRDFIQNHTELVVLVTPHIVRSTSQRELATPDKNLSEASDSQTILLGKLNKLYGAKSASPHGNYSGNVGYIVE